MQSNKKAILSEEDLNKKLKNIRTQLPYGGMAKIAKELLISPTTVSKCLNGIYVSYGLTVPIIEEAIKLIEANNKRLRELLEKF